MNDFSDNPKDTGQGGITQAELDQKIKEFSRCGKKPLIMDEFWDKKKSDTIDELREKHPHFKAGNDN